MRIGAWCVAVAMVWLAVAGCAPTTLETMRADSGNRDVLTSRMPFRDTYRRLKERAVDRYAVQAAYLGSELYDDLRRGDIRIVFDDLHQAYIQVLPAEGGGSRVVVSYAPAESRGIVGDVQSWLRDDYQAPRTMRPAVGIGVHVEGEMH